MAAALCSLLLHLVVEWLGCVVICQVLVSRQQEPSAVNGLSRVVPQCVLDTNCKDLTMVASQCCCLMACVHKSEKPGGGVGVCDVVWPLVSPSL